MTEKLSSGHKPQGLPGLKVLITIVALAGTFSGWAFLASRNSSGASTSSATLPSALSNMPLPTLVPTPGGVSGGGLVSTSGTSVPRKPLRAVSAPPAPVVVSRSS